MVKNKTVLLVSPFVNPFSLSNSRVFSIADILIEKGFKPIIITANFDHNLKQKYKQLSKSALYETILINVPTYSKNLSLFRVISHVVFAFKVKYLVKLNISSYSVVYCTAPSTLAPFFLSRLCKKRNVTFVLDVIDLWPESYFVFFKKFDFILKYILFPWSYISKLTYRQSTLVIAESKEYARYVSQFRTDRVESYYLGVDLKQKEELLKKSSAAIPLKKTNEIWVAYGGSLNNSYDFDVILSSFLLIQKQFTYAKLLFIGGGELGEYIQNFITKFEINGFITGYVSYPDYLKWLSQCDIAINSFRENTRVVHSYKYNDYIACGCCILNNLKGETWSTVEEYVVGLNFDYNQNTLEKCLQKLLMNPESIKQYRNNSMCLAENDLSKERIYNSLFENINSYINYDV